VSSDEPDVCGGKVDGGEEVAGGLVVACGDAAELLELGEEVLDQVARFVEVAVVVPLLPPVLARRDDGGLACRGERLQHARIGIVCYALSYLDRINIGFAQLQMKSDLDFGDAVYGLGAGIFFIGYFLFEVPSNLLLEKIGARKTITRIMVIWGLVSPGMAFVHEPWLFYVMRFLLGLFEAGFFPGIILYFTYWYPGAYRARIIAIFMSGIAVAGVLGGPVSGWIMNDMAGVWGLKGWHWMFILEGLPTTLLGLYVFFYLDDKPDESKGLTADEKDLIRRNLELERASGVGADGGHGTTFTRSGRRSRILRSTCYHSATSASYAAST
jgi:MFS family permease